MPLVKNQIIPLTIDALSSDGNGVGRFEGQAVFVPFAAVGDVLSVKVVKICKSYAFGIVESVLTPGTGRIPCGLPYFRPVRRLLFPAPFLRSRACGKARLRGGRPAPHRRAGCARAGHPSLSTDRALPEQAVFKPAFMRAAAIGRCLGLSAPARTAEPIAATLCALLTQYHISVYDEQAHRGLARHIYLRHAVTNGSVLVCLVCNGRSLPHAQDICAALVKAHPEVFCADAGTAAQNWPPTACCPISSFWTLPAKRAATSRR